MKHSAESKYYGKTNRLVLGKMKGEANVIPVTEYVGLKSKIYLFKKKWGLMPKKGNRRKCKCEENVCK